MSRNVVFGGYSQTRYIRQPSSGRCPSLREISISNELGRWPIEARPLQFTGYIHDFVHRIWCNFMKLDAPTMEVTTRTKFKANSRCSAHAKKLTEGAL